MCAQKLENELREETGKWLSRIKRELNSVKPANERGREFLKNINAYVNDCRHFTEKGDLINAFEAVIWAWAWLEIGKELNFFG